MMASPRRDNGPLGHCLGPRCLGSLSLPPTHPLPQQEWRGLTIDSQGHLSLPGPHPRHHRSAHVLPSILLADGFEGQGLFIAQDLGVSGRIRHKEWGRALLVFQNPRAREPGLVGRGRSPVLCRTRAGTEGRRSLRSSHGWEQPRVGARGAQGEERTPWLPPRGVLLQGGAAHQPGPGWPSEMTLRLNYFEGPRTCLLESFSASL